MLLLHWPNLSRRRRRRTDQVQNEAGRVGADPVVGHQEVEAGATAVVDIVVIEEEIEDAVEVENMIEEDDTMVATEDAAKTDIRGALIEDLFLMSPLSTIE